MTAIWQNDGTQWKLLAPSSYPNEATLHGLVEEAPQLLPLAGSPRIAIVGREVQLGAGYADLVGVEITGRLVLIEIKLARNAEARRAVIAQVLAYAAYLHGLDPAALSRDVLGRHLQQRGWSSLAEAAASRDQEGEFEPAEFESGVQSSLTEGRFRLVLVLDDAPDELVRLVGYLEAISDRVLIDLISIASYRIGESSILVPQRVEPERPAEPETESPKKARGRLVTGADDFVAQIDSASPDQQPVLRQIAQWAQDLEVDGLCQLSTYHGVNNRWILLPRLQPENVGLVSLWNDRGGYVQFWRSVFERRAPQALAAIEELIAPIEVRQGNTVRDPSSELLALLERAYREANERLEVQAVK